MGAARLSDVPHKLAIMRHLDRLAEAASVGAVNTVAVKAGGCAAETPTCRAMRPLDEMIDARGARVAVMARAARRAPSARPPSAARCPVYASARIRPALADSSAAASALDEFAGEARSSSMHADR